MVADRRVKLIFVGLLLLSTATLLFEINLTRLFSVSQFYHFAFMIVSLALLGFGVSGAVLALFSSRNGSNLGSYQARFDRIERLLSCLALGFSLSNVGSLVLVILFPFDSFSIAWDRRQVWILAFHYLALATPFFCSGAAVGLLLASRPRETPQIYFVNLLGSALGCLLALFTPGLLGAEGIVLLCGASGAVAALLFALAGTHPALNWLGAASLVTFFLMTVLLIIDPPLFSIRLSPYKDLSYLLSISDARWLSSRWNAFSRVDVVSSASIRSSPGLSYRFPGQIPSQNGLTVDGGDLSGVVTKLDNLDFVSYLPGALSHHLHPGANTLLLESHGGLDILTAYALKAASITAVEPNALVVDGARPIYLLPGVETIIESGRSYVRGTSQLYDLVVLCLNTPYRPVRSGAYSLSEEYRYTVEAFEDILARLEPGGMLQASRWLQTPPSESIRLFALAVEALERRGVRPEESLLFFRGFNMATLLVKPDSFSPAELAAARTWLQERSFDLIYAPDIQPDEVNRYSILLEPVYYNVASELLFSSDRDAWYADSTFDVAPPTDDHPFFGHYFKWSQAAQVWAEAGHTWQPFGGAGYFVLLVLLALASAAALGVILLPLIAARLAGRLRPGVTRARSASLAYFGLIGFGYLLGEIPLSQQFILFLGQPVYGLTAVLFALLLFSGLGSLTSPRLPHRPALVALIMLLLIYPILLPRLFSLFLGARLALRLLIAVLTLAPLGFLLGLPFPKGIAVLEFLAPELIPWAWGVNGAASVVASVGAALLALSAGFSWVLLLGSLCYLGALVVSNSFAEPRQIPSPSGRSLDAG